MSSARQHPLRRAAILAAALAMAAKNGSAIQASQKPSLREWPIRPRPRTQNDPPPGATKAPTGLVPVLKQTFKSIGADRVLAVAGGVVFAAILALFPALTALVSLYALFADPKTIADQLALVGNIMPGQAFDFIQQEVTRIVSKGTGPLGLVSVIGLGTAVWSANSGTKGLLDALNVAYEVPETRGFVRLNLVALAFTLGGLVFVLLAIGAVVVLPLVFSAIGLQSVGALLVKILQWPALLALTGLALAVLYRFGPSPRGAKWRWVSPGSATAAVVWLSASGLFSFYLSHFADYGGTYGSLGAAIGLMMWMWITTCVILMGAELNAAFEKRGKVEASKPAPAKDARKSRIASDPLVERRSARAASQAKELRTLEGTVHQR